MFYYFGYGSNMDALGLRLKEVMPHSAEPAILPGWQLKFNTSSLFEHEGGMANVEPADHPNQVVHGMLYVLSNEDLTKLDDMEGLGIVYQRVQLEILTYNQKKMNAYVYTSLPDYIDNAALPSERYLSILIRGAIQARLEDSYIQGLRAQPIKPLSDQKPFTFPNEPATTFTQADLTAHSGLMAIAGAVFNLNKTYFNHKLMLINAYRERQSGKDMTLHYIHRSGHGQESIDDFHHNRLPARQVNYLNNTLYAYDRTFQYEGRFVYT